MKKFKVTCFTAFFLLLLCGPSLCRPKDKSHINVKKIMLHGADLNTNTDEEYIPKCGYEGCPKLDSNMINVHLVPHTHDDVGWLKTVDQYYYGSKTTIQKAGVQYILDSVIQELLSDPKKRFIYVESAFFFKWWKEQTKELQSQVHTLVQEGRLEFINGAWSMNDEAATHYHSIVDQFTWGLRKLNDTFGECGRPRVGWQIDPFGHSREQASLFARMGFDGMFFGRLDYQDKENRLDTKQMEMIWHGSANLGEAADLFTGILYNNYGPPPGFCWDILCSDEPIIDAKWSPDNNVKERLDKFFYYVEQQAEFYRTKNVFLTMGGDFTYMAAHTYFKNMDKLIRYGNERQREGSNINLLYSTPSCYLKAVHDANITWPTKTDDFFPYASDPHSFWTGYFTSRPTLKRFERVGNHFLQVCKQLTSMALLKENHFESHLSFLREQMGMMQHHDAVTGTEKQHVAADYAKLLEVGIRSCGVNTRITLNQFTTGDILPPSVENYHDQKNPHERNEKFRFDSCMDLNISKCEVSEKSDNFVVTLYNPLALSTYQYIRIPVPDVHYKVLDYKGIEAPVQFVPIPETVRDLHYRLSNGLFDMVVLANELPPMGYKSYFVQRTLNISNPNPEVIQLDDSHSSEISMPREDEEVVIGNQFVNVTFGTNGMVSSVMSGGVERQLNQNFYYYEGALGDNKEFKNRSSGAYIFRPNNTIHVLGTKAKIVVIKGLLVDEVHQVFNDWISQVVRVYKSENNVEFEWMVGPIPIDDHVGKEIVSRFSSDIESAGTFYTDSNGREMLKRQRNTRETWPIKLDEKVAGNYYPVTAKIALEDVSSRMAVLNDRAQGGSSLNDGELELMVHRRLLHDDAFGVDEALNETAYGKGLIARGHHYLFLDAKSNESPTLEARERFVQLRKLLPVWPFFSDASSMTFTEWQNKYTHIRSGISLSLPANVNLMTFEPWKDDTYLVRFEHIMEKDEDPIFSKSVKFNLKDTFLNLDFDEFRETNLAANQWMTDVKRFKFVPDSNQNSEIYNERLNELDAQASSYVNPRLFPQTFMRKDSVEFRDINMSLRSRESRRRIRDPEEFDVTLGPMQIRTFVFSKSN